MAPDGVFFDAVGKLMSPWMGTELMGPLLYQMIRSLRPVSVLEVGMGYTTPFLAKALDDNVKDFHREKEQLFSKTRRLMQQNEGRPASGGTSEAWFVENPPLCNPSFYAGDHDPRLHAIDNLSSPRSSARAVIECIELLGLMGRINVQDGDFRGCSRKIDAKHMPFDFAWFDCGGYHEYRDFLDEYWEHISNNGGILILHLTLSSVGINSIVKDLKLKQATTHFGDFELISMLEPHKVHQSSFTMIRKISEFRETYADLRPDFVDTTLQEACDLVNSAEAQ